VSRALSVFYEPNSSRYIFLDILTTQLDSMADNEDFEDDLFADVYADDTAAPPAKPSQPAPVPSEPVAKTEHIKTEESTYEPPSNGYGQTGGSGYDEGIMNSGNGTGQIEQYQGHDEHDDNEDGYGPIGIKEDG